MKLFFAAFILIFGSHFASARPTATSDPSDLECTEQASTYAQEKLEIQPSRISFYDGALVGDGINAVEIFTFQVDGETGLYKVEVDVDGCRFRQFERINN